jgi:hypothetical protein
MSRRWMAVIGLAAALGPGVSWAQGQGGRLSAMEDRITALEDQLRESQAVIKAQQEKLDTTPSVSAGAQSLDKFLSTVSIGGHVAGSYVYNFNNPKANSATNTLCQFHCNHNEFSLDAAKLEIGKAASDPGTVGFQLDLLYGQNAAILRNLSPGTDKPAAGQPLTVASDQELFLQQAFATYNFNGVEMKLGKFETLLGYEVVDGDGNSNVTLGVLNTFGIPFFHTGLMFSGTVGENLAWAGGVVNGFNNSREFGDKKGFLGKLAWTSGPFFASFISYVGDLGETRTRPSLSLGADVPDDKSSATVFDAILQYQPSDSTKFWLNVDAGRTRQRSAIRGGFDHPDWIGGAVGVRRQLTDKLYFAVRGEYFNDDGGSRIGFLDAATDFRGDEINVYTATVTFGYQVAPNLQARLEYRRDWVDCEESECNLFFGKGQVAFGEQDKSDLAVLELIYSFD